MLTAFIPKEIREGEARAAASPETVQKLVARQIQVVVESGLGSAAGIGDSRYADAGAKVVDAATGYGQADLVLKLHPPTVEETGRLKEGTLLISFLYPLQNADVVEALRARKVSAMAMDGMPRITRAQKMDALSSQANLAGYKAVIMAAHALTKIFPLMMTPAGTIQPARVVILGAGVAGLQAIATAKRLGAVVEVSDVRPAVKEQVESLGGKFIEVPVEAGMEDAGGYAKEQSEDFLRKQRELVRKRIVAADVVITTAAIPGKPAPRLVTADMVEDMKEGSVLVDLAVETGGNCELSERGRTVVKHGVTLIGEENVPSMVPRDATEMYARNVLNLVQELVDKEGTLKLDREDEVVQGVLVTHEGEVVHPRFGEALKTGGVS